MNYKPCQIVEFFKQMNVMCVSEAFFFALQKEVLHKIIWMVWCCEQVREDIS